MYNTLCTKSINIYKTINADSMIFSWLLCNSHLNLGGAALLRQGLDEAPVDAAGDAAEPADGEHREDDARYDQVEAGHDLDP